MDTKEHRHKENRNNKIPEKKAGWLLDYRRAVSSDPDIQPWNIPIIREYLEKYSNNEEIQKIDRWLVEDIQYILKVNPAIEDDDSQPLEKWWWHLHKIAEGTYPKDMLPEYLRNVH